MNEHANDQDNPLQGYFEWQVTTLMLAHDLQSPIDPKDQDAIAARRGEVAEEVGQMVRDLLPKEYLEDQERDFPPELMMEITRATLQRAVSIAGP